MIQVKELPIGSIELKSDRDQFFTSLYERIFPAVAKFVRNHHGTLDDAKDIFHDALIIFYEKKAGGRLDIDLTEDAYIFGIVKNLWIKRAKRNQTILLSESESLIDIPDHFDLTPMHGAIVTFLKSAGEKCMSLLQAFYYDKNSLDSIRSQFGFSSIRSATVQKYKCLEKVRDVIRAKSKQYEDFFE